ncbi:MAG: hypothetical protein WCF23_22590 [Candidatus Nitrosopolaris sp.]
MSGNRRCNRCQNQVILPTSVVAVAIGFILSVLFFGVLHNRALLTKQQNDPSLQGSYKKNLEIALVTEGLSYPTSKSFVDDNKIIVFEKVLFLREYCRTNQF